MSWKNARHVSIHVYSSIIKLNLFHLFFYIFEANYSWSKEKERDLMRQIAVCHLWQWQMRISRLFYIKMNNIRLILRGCSVPVLTSNRLISRLWIMQLKYEIRSRTISRCKLNICHTHLSRVHPNVTVSLFIQMLYLRLECKLAFSFCSEATRLVLRPLYPSLYTCDTLHISFQFFPSILP